MRSGVICTRAAVLAAAAALLGTTVMATTASAGTARRQTPAGGPGHWSQVTANGAENFADIGLARGGRGTLNVIWASGQLSAGHAKIIDTPISSSGAVGRAVTIASGEFLVTDPDATVTGTRIDAIWNGIESGAPGAPEGTFVASRNASGGSWSAPANVPALTAIPDTSSSDSAATGSDGKPWVAFYGTDSLAVVHIGHPERELGPTNACCVYYPGFGVDGHSGATWIAYQSLINKHEGIFVRPLASSGAPAGPARLVPGTGTKGLTAIVNQRIAITGRGKGRKGVYLAYETGYPFALGIDLVSTSLRRPVQLARTNTSHQFAGATVTADPAGGLWVAWYTGDGSPARLSVRQSNSSVTRFGRTLRVGLPSGTSVVWKVYISAQATRLDVVALLTRNGKTAYWATQVR
jgi:hypothetical protein